MNICKMDHRYDKEFESLPDAQDNEFGGRHKCAGCAYEEGFKDGTAGVPRKTNFSHLPDSQAGTIRHKDVKAAYDKGYEKGQQSNS